MPKVIRTLPAADYLRQCFDYAPDTGILRWRERPREHFRSLHASNAWNAKQAGKPAGAPFKNGYFYTNLLHRKILVSRIIWKMHHGTEPHLVDHADRNPSNNRIENLRSVNHRQSRMNAIKPAGSGGLPGVSLLPGGKFRAQIKDGPRMRHIGVFDTAELAHEAYKLASKAAFGDYSPFR